jgi:hypothetical protein
MSPRTRRHAAAMNEFDEDRIRRAAVFAPIRMLSGFVAGGVLGILAFGLAWLPFWPSSLEGVVRVLVLLGTTGLITGAFGTLMFAVRPLQRWWHLVVCIWLGSLGGLFAGAEMRSTLLADCMHGTGPQASWCNVGYSFLPFFLGSLFAGGIVALAISAVGVRPSSPASTRDSGEWID